MARSKDEPKRGRTAVIVGLVLMAVSLVPGIASFVVVTGNLSDTESAEPVEVPGWIDVELGPGEHAVFEPFPLYGGYAPTTTRRRGSSTTIPSYTGPASITADDVEVTGPDGRSVPVVDDSLSSGNPMSATRFDLLTSVIFDVPTEGTYRVSISGPAGAEAYVGPTTGTVLSGLVPWFVIGGTSAVLFVAGGITWFVGVLRRPKRPLPPARSPFGPPPPYGLPGPGYPPVPGYGVPGYGTPGYGPGPQPGYGPGPQPGYAPAPHPGYAPAPHPGARPSPPPGYGPAPANPPRPTTDPYAPPSAGAPSPDGPWAPPR